MEAAAVLMAGTMGVRRCDIVKYVVKYVVKDNSFAGHFVV